MEIASAAFLRDEIARHLPLFEYHPGFQHTYVTTVYYDTKDRSLYRQAERSYDNNVKIRVKEYSYREGDGEFIAFPHCFVEVKERASGTVLKRRVPLPKSELCRLFRGEDVWGSVLAITGGSDGGTGALRKAYRSLRAYIARYEVLATSVISYRRSVYQESEDELRITFDDSIAVYDVNPRAYEETDPLSPKKLGQPRRRYDKVILEIKCPSCQYPGWLQSALRHHVSKPLSKFTTSVRYLTDSDTLGNVDPEGDDRRASGGDRGAAEAAAGSSLESASEDLDDTTAVNEPIEH